MSGIRRARTRRTDAARFTGKRDDDLVATRLAQDAAKTVGKDAATQVRRELALDVARQPAAVRVSVAHLREHRLRVLGDELVQNRALGGPAAVAGERPSRRAGRTFVEAAREHTCAQWKFRAAIALRSIATFRFAASDARTPATPSARDSYRYTGAHELYLSFKAGMMDGQVCFSAVL